MKIIGINLAKISIERKNPIKDKLEISSNLNIEDIRKEEVSVSKSSTLLFDFNYTVNYNPNIAQIQIKGSAITFDDQNEAEGILKEWKQKKFEHPIKIALLNFILNKCNIKSMQFEDEMNLPTHINLPQLTQNSKEAPKSEKTEKSNNKDSKNPASYTG